MWPGCLLKLSADLCRPPAFKYMLLIHPPVTKPGEPPAGLARLAHALKGRGVTFRVWDANLEGLLYLLSNPGRLRMTPGPAGRRPTSRKT